MDFGVFLLKALFEESHGTFIGRKPVLPEVVYLNDQ
jgi:hypothetical protein